MKITDLLFPPKCFICDEPIKNQMTMLCNDCMPYADRLYSQQCNICGQSMDSCRCLCIPHVKNEHFLFWYADEVIKRMIYGVKTNVDIRIVNCLALQLAKKLYGNAQKNKDGELAAQAICFVPRKKKRVVYYGFDQSYLLAASLSKQLSLPVIRVLEPTGRADEQKLLSGSQRRINVKGKFAVSPEMLIKSADEKYTRLLLVDDVITTGSTITECASLLHSCGVSDIEAVAIARVEHANYTKAPLR